MFMIVYVPLMITFVIMFYGYEVKKLWNSFSKMLIISVVGSLIGFAIYAFILGPRYGGGLAIESPIILRDSETIKNNILLVPKLILIGLGIDFNNMDINLYTIFIAIKACFWFYVLIFILKLPKEKSNIYSGGGNFCIQLHNCKYFIYDFNWCR